MSTATSGTTKSPVHQEQPDRMAIWRETKRFIKFCLVGLSNGAVDFVVLAVLVLLFDPQTTPALIAANTVAFLTGSINSFTWNSRLTFGTPRPYASRWFVLFLLINAGGLVISNVSLVTFKWFFEMVGLEGRAAILAAKAPGTVVLAAYSYLSYRKLFLGSAGGAIVSSALGKVRGTPGP